MLAINNLEVVYNRVMLVLKGISLTVPDGAIVALLGPNGAGKTTTLRAITGLLSIHDGAATKGRVILGPPPPNQEIDLLAVGPDQAVQSGIAHVMEGRRIFATLSVEENLIAGAFGVRRPVLKRRLQQAYQSFPILAERRRQAAGFLSGGEQQMLAVARALMSEPRLLLLDEPSLGLAPRIVAEVAEIVRRINQDGVSVLIVEQNAELALSLATYGYVMENGKVVVDGPSAELRADRDIQEFYLGAAGGSSSYRDVKRYRRRKRWLG